MMNLYFIDFETTGLNPYHDSPIEIAIKKNGSQKFYQTFIKPPLNGIHYKYVSPKIQNITNITDEMIEKDGIEKNEATIGIINFIKENSEVGDIYLAAHNGTCFDFIILKKLFKEYCNTSNRRLTRLDKEIINKIKFIDTLLLARLSLKGDSYSQPSLCRRFRIENEQEHRALGDINALEKLYGKLTLNLSYSNGGNENIYIDDPKKVYENVNIV